MRLLFKRFSTAVTKPPVPPSASAKPSSSSGGFFGRLTALLVGAGLGFGASFFLINEEVQDSNIKLAIAFRKLEDRVSKLESKK